MTRLIRPRYLVAASVLAGLFTFAVIQDRITAAGARQYVAMQREQAAAGRAPVRVDAVMAPAIASSARQGALWGGGVFGLGLIVAAAAARLGRSPRQ